MIKALILLPFLLPISAGKTLEEPRTVSSTLKTVTVYRSGAELEHIATANLQFGDNELIIEGISNNIDINSLQVNCPAAVTILGIEYNKNAAGEEISSPALRTLKDSIESLNEQKQQINVHINTETELLEVLRANREIKGNQGLSVAELAKLMTYYKTRSNELQTSILANRNKLAKIDRLTTKVNTLILEEIKKSNPSAGRLNLQLSVAVSGSHEFKITYITQSAFWVPYYDVKCDNIKSPIQFIYKARIAQTTGIDWKKVKLSLSTAAPRQYGNAPVLKTWFLSYIDPINVLNRNLSYSNTINSALAGKVAGVTVRSQSSQRETISLRGENGINLGNKTLYVVNGNIMSKSDYSKINADDIKDVSVMDGTRASALFGAEAANGAIIVTLKEGLEDYISVSNTELDLSYDISLPYDVPSNGKPQIATLKEATVPAAYKYYAVPKLDRDAFLLAEVTDWQKLNLLPGEANIIFEGTYIGKSFIDPASTNDTLNLTLGVDKRVVIKKEKMVDFSSTKFLGSNKVQTLTYEITVKNNKNEPIQIVLKDQYPISTNKEIEVEVLETSDAKINPPVGVMTWIMTIAPGKTEKRRISYSARYPKSKQINLN
jgi:hypothetical protein